MDSKRKYRLNIVINYLSGVDPEDYRTLLIQLFQNIAWLHKFEFAKSICHPFPDAVDSENQKTYQVTSDLIYLRQTDGTRITLNNLKKVISALIYDSHPLIYGVDIFCLPQRTLADHPFPNKFYRFLSYPYVEIYKDGQTAISLYSEHVLPNLGKEQDPSLN